MSDKTSGGGVGLGSLLFVLFLGLRLTGHIDWSWWWVTAPLWGPLALVLSILLVEIAVAGIAWAVEAASGVKAGGPR